MGNPGGGDFSISPLVETCNFVRGFCQLGTEELQIVALMGERSYLSVQPFGMETCPFGVGRPLLPAFVPLTKGVSYLTRAGVFSFLLGGGPYFAGLLRVSERCAGDNRDMFGFLWFSLGGSGSRIGTQNSTLVNGTMD